MVRSWRLPFAVLESSAGRTLLDRYVLFHAPSATVLRELMSRRKPSPIRTLLAVGNPPAAAVTGLDQALSSLKQVYGPGNAKVLLGTAATEAALKSGTAGYDVIEVASHGVLDNRHPLYSYLALAPGGGEDGFFEAREMAELKLQAQLVVLSACETGAGREGGAEGVIGMTWALFLAGSPASVASLWKVDSEATSELTLELHKAVRAGRPKAAALRKAALIVRSNPRFRHPFYWAAFTLSGDGF